MVQVRRRIRDGIGCRENPILCQEELRGNRLEVKTVRSYTAAFRNYRVALEARAFKEGYTPVTESSLREAVVHWFAGGKVKIRSIERYISGVKGMTMTVGLWTVSAEEEAMIRKEVRALRKIRPDTPLIHALDIPPRFIGYLATKEVPVRLLLARTYSVVAVCLGSRYGNLLSVRVEDVAIEEDNPMEVFGVEVRMREKKSEGAHIVKRVVCPKGRKGVSYCGFVGCPAHALWTMRNVARKEGWLYLFEGEATTWLKEVRELFSGLGWTNAHRMTLQSFRGTGAMLVYRRSQSREMADLYASWGMDSMRTPIQAHYMQGEVSRVASNIIWCEACPSLMKL